MIPPLVERLLKVSHGHLTMRQDGARPDPFCWLWAGSDATRLVSAVFCVSARHSTVGKRSSRPLLRLGLPRVAGSRLPDHNVERVLGGIVSPYLLCFVSGEAWVAPMTIGYIKADHPPKQCAGM